LHVLQTERIDNVLVFSRTKRGADRITKNLAKQGFSATAMHSNKSQNQRRRALDGFKGGRFQIMVATDIAARGIDVDTISHVINYDTPNQAEDYIHRIGRTGRAETSGDAITFVAKDEESYIRNIERHTGQRVPRKSYGDFGSDGASDGRGGRSSNGNRQGGRRDGGRRSSRR
ncbi:MAG: C-terminal helicase domain-containing protein, partial [Rhodothermales bacterium]